MLAGTNSGVRMTLNRETVFQIFKYSVYTLLTMNVYLFFKEEFAAAAVQFPNGLTIGDIPEAFVATIDTAAWVVLLLVFELETYVLEDRHINRIVAWSLKGLRIVCYVIIFSAFLDYVNSLVFVEAVTPLAGVSDLCALAGDWSYTVQFDQYEAITASNCNSLSSASTFLQFDGISAVVDQRGHAELVRLAWVDVINAGVWLLVVLLLEIDVRLQEKGLFEGMALRVSNALKYLLYGILFLALVYWFFKGDFVDTWDAFLWLVAFFFIELNVIEWRHEDMTDAAG